MGKLKFTKPYLINLMNDCATDNDIKSCNECIAKEKCLLVAELKKIRK